MLPEDLVQQVDRILKAPDQCLNEGTGRLILGAIRRVQVNAMAAQTQGYPSSPLEQFQTLLASNLDLCTRVLDLLELYLSKPDESWRLVWLLYLSDIVF